MDKLIPRVLSISCQINMFIDYIIIHRCFSQTPLNLDVPGSLFLLSS